MCGIAGIYAYRESAPPADRDELLRVRDAMARRGPDGAGLWCAADGRLGLAHRRLAIIDLSASASQPMVCADGRQVVTYNGEIYNYRELRRELERAGRVFRSNSDTEVLLHLYAERGEAMVDALRGMFAFAIWDASARTLFLARDPFGIKPLYYADDGGTFRFASQVKALRAGGAIADAAEPAGSVGFLLLGSVPEPYTLHRSIRALPAGSTLTVRPGGLGSPRSYFDVRAILREAEDAPPRVAEDARDVLRQAVRDSVRAHRVADVPVGMFLSAGIDSGTLTGLCAEIGGADLRTLTLGFAEFEGTPQDEAPLAERVARHYGTQHRTCRIERADFEREREAIVAAMDQPSIDGVNTYFVSRAAAGSGMKVALSGLGGDELLGGYPSFRDVPRSTRVLGWARHVPWLGRAVRAATAPWVGRLASPKYAGLLEHGGSTGGAYLLRRGLLMPWELEPILDPATARAGLEELDLVARLEAAVVGLRSARAKVAALELTWYMRNQLLRDADWAGMAHSVEIRVPLVDASLFRSIARLLLSAAPPGKSDLARVAAPALPTAVVDRAKTGFTTPVREWIGGGRGASDRGLRAWARTVLPPQPRLVRVLALVTDAYGGQGGIAKFNRDLIGALASMGECAQVVALPRVASRPIEGVPERVRVVRDAAQGKARFAVELVRALRRGPYDLVVIGHLNLAALGTLAAAWLGAPSMLVAHGIDAWRAHRSVLVRRSLSRVRMIVGVSQLTLDRFRTWASIASTRTRVLPNCVDLGQFTPGPKPTDLERALALQGRKVLMTLGRLSADERYKGVDEVIEALPVLRQDIPNIAYLVCGDGTDRARLEAKARDLGVGDIVRFAGFVPEERKVDYYRLADAFVLPGTGEGFGIVLLEALACGVPVLGSLADGSAEALMHGELGELVDPASPAQLRQGISKALARGRRVPARLAEYSVEAFQRRVRGIVSEVAG